MSEIRFRVIGVTEHTRRAWQRTDRTPTDTTTWARVAQAWRTASRSARVIALVAAASVAYAFSGETSVNDITARRIIILRDVSGSMGNTTQRTNAQLAALKANNVSVTDFYPIQGYAISETDFYAFVQPLMKAVAANPQANAIFLISDFKGGDDAANNAEDIRKLKDFLRERRLSLFLSTVDQRPPKPEYYEISSGSGGAVIEDFKNPE